MSDRSSNAGFSLIELLVAFGLLSTVLAIAASLMLQNSRVNKGQLMRADVQSNARTTAKQR